MTEPYDENSPIYGSKGIQVYLKLLKCKYAYVNTDHLLQYSQMEPYQVTDDGYFFSQKQINLFHEKVVELTGNKNIAREAGRFASSPDALGNLQGSIIGLLGPIRYYELIGTFANKISKSALYEARKLAANKVEITVTPYPGVVEKPFQCNNRMGYWEAVSAIFGLNPPVIEHPQCLFAGDDVCRYIVSWNPSPAFILKRIRNISAAIFGLFCLWTFFSYSLNTVVIATLASFSTVLLINWFARRVEIQDLYRAIEDMRGDSEQFVEQVEINYEHSLLINEIGQVLAKESETEGLLSGVVDILQKRLDYDHCLIFLPNSEKSGLLLKAGYGIAKEQLEDKQDVSLELHDIESRGLLAEVFFNKQPLLLDSAEDLQKRMSKNLSDFFSEVEIQSLICCPVIYEEESLGVVTVGNDKNRRHLLQRDINLLMGVASQIASRIHNMRLEAHLRQSQKMEAVGILAGGVAHDFNNILTTILGYSEIIAGKLSESNPIKGQIKEIYQAGERAAGLTRQLLAFSRKQVMEMQVTNLNIVVNDMGKMLKRLIGEDLTLEIVTGSAIGNIKADVGQLEQVLMNLVVNARDAMPCGGRLTIETGEIYLDEKYVRKHSGLAEGKYAMLTVADTGVGMPPEVQKRIFEPFYSTKELGKGTGLGLSTVYGIVKQHHGHVYVYSEPDHGTTFKIYFPVVSDSIKDVFLTPANTMPEGTETVLVVDDEASIRRLVSDTLEPLGYTIIGAACGEEALDILRGSQEKVDLLLSDVIMPGMDGRQLSEIVHQERPEIKTVLMSGYTDDVIADRGILAPGIVFVNKPLLPVALANKIRAVLDS